MSDRKVFSQSEINFNIVLKLSEEEARALKEITAYGSLEFLKVFYTHLGKSTLKPHEKGIVSLFETIKRELPKHLSRMNNTRKTWNSEL